ncbi:AtpZ/AtpI family protein [Hydrogenivirga sp.]
MKGFFEEIEKKIKELEKRRETSVWYTLSYVGSVGVILLLPVVLGTYLGWWLDGRYRAGKVSWTITFMILGLMVGIYNVYRVVYRREVSRKN